MYFVDELVSPTDHGEFVGVVELLGNVLSEGVAGASRRDAPAAAVIGVGPKQVAHGALVRDLLEAIELSNIVERIGGGREPAVQTEETIFDGGSQRQIVE